MIDREDIQGLALSSYDWQPFSCLFLVRFENGDARAFVSRSFSGVSSAASSERSERRRRNMAFTASGLRALGLGEEWLASFPREFLQGMAHPERSFSLGDTGKNAPAHWEFGSANEPVDALLAVYAPTEAELDRESDAVEALLSRYGLSASTEDTYLPDDRRDHFGRLLAPADPRLYGLSWRRRDRRNPKVPVGEFILGYRDASGYVAEGPRGPVHAGTRPPPRLTDYGRAVDLGHNGTYLVLRKLEQDLPEFVQRVRAHDTQAAEAPIVRRRAHGSLYRHRLYGERYDPAAPESAEHERGTMFLAVNANLRRQFEFMQGERLGGTSAAPEAAEPFVRVRGGAYLFMPGLTALGYLTEL